jgi:hypothetical protein
MPTLQQDAIAKDNVEESESSRGGVDGDRKMLPALYGPHALLIGLSRMGLF